MRVLFLTPSLGAGGAERHASILLPGLRDRGIDARLLALGPGGAFLAPLQAAGVPVEVLDMRHQLDLRRVAGSHILRRFAAQAIVSRGVNGLYIGHLIARWRGAGHAYNDHVQIGLALSQRREAMVSFLAPRLDLVIGVADEQTSAWLRRGCRAERIRIIPNGVPVPSVSEDRSAIRRELDIPETAVVAVLVAGLRAVKRVPDFVRAVQLARATAPDLVGVIVGDGPERASVQAAIGDSAAVRLLGHRDDVPRILRAADIFTLSSQLEAAPMAILEAMAMGLPIVSTDVGVISELLEPGRSGLLVPPGGVAELSAALARLASDAGLRGAMGAQAAARHRARWDAARMIDDYATALELVLARPSRAGRETTAASAGAA